MCICPEDVNGHYSQLLGKCYLARSYYTPKPWDTPSNMLVRHLQTCRIIALFAKTSFTHKKRKKNLYNAFFNPLPAAHDYCSMHASLVDYFTWLGVQQINTHFMKTAARKKVSNTQLKQGSLTIFCCSKIGQHKPGNRFPPMPLRQKQPHLVSTVYYKKAIFKQSINELDFCWFLSIE